jgi:hypothetical protein
MPESRPPFFNLRAVSVVICHRSFRLELPSNKLWPSEVSGHTAPCADEEIPDPAEVRALIVDHLRENAYDVSSLSSGGR